MAAAENDHLDVLRWLIAEGCPVPQDICSYAGCSSIEVLNYLKKLGYEWDETCCAAAAREGDLELLHWLREQGCPWNETTSIEAEAMGHRHVLRWAVENGCPTTD